jgi:hypothetical protein
MSTLARKSGEIHPTMRRVIIHIVVMLFILLIGASPLISALVAGTVADANGCQLDEGSIHPCIINGEDWGKDLYTFGMLGWLAIGTIPIAVGVAMIYLLIVIIVAMIQATRRRRAAPYSLPPN